MLIEVNSINWIYIWQSGKLSRSCHRSVIEFGLRHLALSGNHLERKVTRSARSLRSMRSLIRSFVRSFALSFLVVNINKYIKQQYKQYTQIHTHTHTQTRIYKAECSAFNEHTLSHSSKKTHAEAAGAVVVLLTASRFYCFLVLTSLNYGTSTKTS